MSIYDNMVGETRKVQKSSTPPKDIKNSKNLTDIVKQMKSGPKTAKEVLFDHDGNVIGILQRNDEPYFLSPSEKKEFLKLAEG